MSKTKKKPRRKKKKKKKNETKRKAKEEEGIIKKKMRVTRMTFMRWNPILLQLYFAQPVINTL